MADATGIEQLEELTDYQRWSLEIEQAEKELEKFHKRAERVNKRYLDERESAHATSKWFNLFFANTSILQASLYAQIPQPEVKRTYTDYLDQLGRVAANVLQRCITPDADDPRDLFDTVMKQVVQDRLVVGLGTVWLRLETDTEEVTLEPMPLTDDLAAPPAMGFDAVDAPDAQETLTYERVTDQRVALDYVYWKDFIWSPCRVWQERRWTGRRVYMTRDELIDRFGEDVGSRVSLTKVDHTDTQTPKHMALTTAEVYEIWDRSSRTVIWFSDGYPDILDTKEDPLGLVGFEPCPTPLFANTTTSSTVPRPDYYLYQDQYDELNTVNNRISTLVRAVKMAGVYDSAAEGLQRLLTEDGENVLIPVDSWAAFAERGGMQGAVDWLPLGDIQGILKQLREQREDIKNQIYELTGISDIVRGASKASETLGAQQLKAQFASVRISKLQEEIARFAAELLRIKAEIMVKHFTPELLIEKSNALRTDDAQLAPIAVELLKSEAGFEWRIQVTSDQLAQADYAMQKQDRIELITAVGQYISQVRDVAMAVPAMLPLFVQILKWAVAGFKGARDIEGMIDQQLNALLQQQQQGAQGGQDQDPEAQARQQEAEMKMQQQQQGMQQRQQEFQMNMQGKQMELQHQKTANAMDLLTKIQKMAGASQQ